MLTYTTQCTVCSRLLKFDDSMLGKVGKCRGCKTPIKIERSLARDQSTRSQAEGETIDQSFDGSLNKSVRSSIDKSLKSSLSLGTFGKFKLLRVLGEGAFGIVYEAHDTSLDRKVALKLPSFSATNTKQFDRFIKEGKAAAILRHENIVMVYEAGVVDDKPFISSQLVNGKTLSDYIKNDNVTITQGVQWILDLALAIDYAHAVGIIHRDIKSDNVLIDEACKPYLTDFGLAKKLGDSSQTIDGSVLGTPSYMSPEQARGDVNKVGTQSDQYSLGAVLYEILTGKRPFTGPIHTVLSNVVNTEPPTPRSINESVPKQLEWICLKAMSKSVEDRFANMDTFANALRDFLEGRDIALPSRDIAMTKPTPKRRVVPALTIVGAVLLSVVFGAGVYKFRSSVPGAAPNLMGTATNTQLQSINPNSMEQPSSAVTSKSHKAVLSPNTNFQRNDIPRDDGTEWPLSLIPGSLDKWYATVPESWRWEGTKLIGQNQRSMLWYDKPMGDFSLRFKVTMDEKGDGGVFFWSKPLILNPSNTYEVQIATGTAFQSLSLIILYGSRTTSNEVQTDLQLEPFKEYEYVIHATQTFTDVHINGKRISLNRNNDHIDKQGKVGIQFWSGTVEYSDLSIKDYVSAVQAKSAKDTTPPSAADSQQVQFSFPFDFPTMLLVIDDRVYLKDDLVHGISLSPGEHIIEIWGGGELRYSEPFNVKANEKTSIRVAEKAIESNQDFLKSVASWNARWHTALSGFNAKDILATADARGARRRLDIYHCQIGRDVLKSFLEETEHLALHGCNFIHNIDPWPKSLSNNDIPLKTLAVSRARGLHDSFYKIIDNSPNLEKLTFNYLESLPLGIFNSIRDSSKLRHLELGDCRLNDMPNWNLSAFRNLTELILTGNGFTSQSIGNLSTLRNLERIGLAYNPIDDGCIDQLIRLPNLHTVELRQTKVTEEGLKKLCSHSNIKKIHITTETVTQQTLDRLKTLRPDIDFY